MSELKNKAIAMYNDLFDNQSKVEAFDKIAKKYYFANFGSISKSDFDILMFSIYIERILEKSQDDMKTYSDYKLSKLLGITQTKVSNLKVKKELLYPYDKFEWQKSFISISENAIFENAKIKLFIPDRNLYLEVKNAIEEYGGFVEVQLTTNLLQVRLSYFLDLLLIISEERDREQLIKSLKKKFNENDKDIRSLEKEPFFKALQNQLPETIIELIGECIPVFGGTAKIIAGNLYSAIRKSI